ncbi:hypothetical protein AB7M49_006978 [Bradyrhizobium elkanii]
MSLAACATLGAPSVDKQAYSLSTDCENLARNVSDPVDDGRVTPKTNPKIAVGEYRVALGEANGNITATRTCQANQRKRLAR